MPTRLRFIYFGFVFAAQAIAQAAEENDLLATSVGYGAVPTLGEALENLGRIYHDDDNPIVQEVWLLGRYHGQYHWSDGSAGEDEGYESRRVRFGAQIQLFDKLSLHGQAISGSDFEPHYNGFTELWARWTFNKAFELTIGQQKHRITHDRNVSSRYINYLERSLLTNMLKAEYTPAVTLQGRIDKWAYYTGVFTNAADNNVADTFSDLNSGWSALAAVYYDLNGHLRTDTAYAHFSYLHSEATDASLYLDQFTDVAAAALIVTEGSASVVTEVTAALGGDYGDAFSFNLQPGIFLTDNLQLALRYQIAYSSNPLGLQPQKRYEAEAGLPAGDLYQAAYAGLNYHIARHRLKIMTGVEYAHMGGEDVWTGSVMLRFFFGPHSGGAFPMNQMLKGHFLEID